MALETVGPIQELPDREGYLFRSGSHQIALFRIDDEVRAIDNVCPHAGASLSMGDTDGETVACPWHMWEFSTKTGLCTTISGCEVDVYPVVIEDGIVKVNLPDN